MCEKKFPKNVCFENSDKDPDGPELNFDFEYTGVEPLDGIVIDVDDDQIKLLFYYKKPGNNGDCRVVVEFRLSQSRFLVIADEFGKRANEFRNYKEYIVDRMFA